MRFAVDATGAPPGGALERPSGVSPEPGIGRARLQRQPDIWKPVDQIGKSVSRLQMSIAVHCENISSRRSHIYTSGQKQQQQQTTGQCKGDGHKAKVFCCLEHLTLRKTSGMSVTSLYTLFYSEADAIVGHSNAETRLLLGQGQFGRAILRNCCNGIILHFRPICVASFSLLSSRASWSSLSMPRSFRATCDARVSGCHQTVQTNSQLHRTLRHFW